MNSQPECHLEPRNEVGSQSPTKWQAGLGPEIPLVTVSYPTFTCLKSAIETPEQCVKSIQS